jgi:hypothetical protein
VTGTLRSRRTGVPTATFARVATHRACRTASTQRTVAVRVAVNLAAWRRVQAAAVRKVVLSVAATRPAKTTTKVTVSLRRPA